MTIRIDRALALGVARARRWFPKPSPSLPILMYHSVSMKDDDRRHPYFRTNVSPGQFAQQMAWLAAQGYGTASLDDAIRQLAAGRIPERCVVITFDDGFRDVNDHAWPVLQRHGFCATVFLPTAYISDTRRTFQDRDCLTWSEVAALQRSGLGVGSHTVRHPVLSGLPLSDVVREIRDSKAAIEERLGIPVTLFSHPFAFPQEETAYVRDLRQSLVDAGYACCVTTRVGRVQPGDDLFTLCRIPVGGGDDEALFAAKLAGGYDWFGACQRVVRHAKGWRRAAGRRAGRLTSS